jgi:copper resistance protein C
MTGRAQLFKLRETYPLFCWKSEKKDMRTSRYALKAALAAMIGLGLLCVTGGLAFAAPAHLALPAHAKVLSSDPAIGSTIAQAPTKVTVFAAENINPDPTKSNLQVYGPGVDATDTLISQGNAQVPLSNPKEMSISITPNADHTDGVYVVFWKTVSADDGDPASGSFTFTVRANTAAATPPPASNQNTTAPASTNNTTASGTPIWVPIVAAIIALLVGLGAGLGLGRRKPAPSSIAAMRATIAQDSKQEETSKRP